MPYNMANVYQAGRISSEPQLQGKEFDISLAADDPFAQYQKALDVLEADAMAKWRLARADEVRYPERTPKDLERTSDFE
ncbi:hypothetical protein GB937_010751 [Aspergillus fischeri]|nr:hypothetical protein GB937_010751 [Aspergillus fischeri]